MSPPARPQNSLGKYDDTVDVKIISSAQQRLGHARTQIGKVRHLATDISNSRGDLF